MIKKVETGKRTVYELSRKDKIWVCSECNREYSNIPTQCSCGAPDKVFIEKDLPIKESARKEYNVKTNFIYDATHISAGLIVSLPSADYVTKNLVKRKIIEEIDTKVSTQESTK